MTPAGKPTGGFGKESASKGSPAARRTRPGGVMGVSASIDARRVDEASRQFQRGLFDQAELEFRALVDAGSTHPGAHANLGALCLLRGNSGEAIGHLQRALDLCPDDSGLLTQLGTVLQELGETEEGNACFRRAIATDPHHVDAQWGLALGLLRCGQFEEAWQQYEWRWLTRN
jgi:Flp pilus assembly protein TadD